MDMKDILPDVDPAGNPGVAGALESRARARRRRNARISCSSSWSTRRAAPARTCRTRQHRLPEHHSAERGGALARRSRNREPHPRPTCAGTRWRWCCAPTSITNVGGHIASFASAATLYDVGFNHFLRGRDRQIRRRPGVHPGPFGARRLCARLHLGRLTEEQLDNFRQEVDGKGLSSYPHPWLMPDFWQFPTVSMGLGPADGDLPGALHALSAGPRHHRSAGPQGLGVHGRRRNGRAGIAGRDLAGRPRETRQPDLRHQLQPAAPRRPGARQRQDHPGTGSAISAAPAGT